jgi:HNH endonuclease
VIYPKSPKDPDPDSKQHVVKWFELNPDRKNSVISLVHFLREFFKDDQDHGYLNKAQQNYYRFGGSYPCYGNARVTFNTKTANVRFWLDGANRKLLLPDGAKKKTLKSASGTDLFAADFTIKSESDFPSLTQFFKVNDIPGWRRVRRKMPRLDFTAVPIIGGAIELDMLNNDLEAEVKKSLEDSSASRRARLKRAQKRPIKRTISVVIYGRNPDVVAEVLSNAKGECKSCFTKAPFARRDGSPYLEVHHRTPLALGGDDTVENAIAMCPNCHRKAHFG